MILDVTIYGEVFKWVTIRDDEDADFNLELKPNAPANIRVLFRKMKALIQRYEKRVRLGR